MSILLNFIMDFKSKINQVLQDLHYSVDDLALHLGISAEELSQSIESKRLELRTLEFISKELRVPLYSFFREEGIKESAHDISYYLENNTGRDLSFPENIEEVFEENRMLRKRIKELEQNLENCSNKLKAITE